MNETTEIKNAIGVLYAFKKYKLKYENMVEDFADDEYKTACEMILILEKWLKNEEDIPHKDSDQVNSWIVRLNDLMNRIHRPFAHRTYQAIRKYVVNYPIDGDSGMRLAMADQIEQKILPKFRGLDVGDQNVGGSLDDLIGLIRELNDKKLADAVEQARSEEEHLFVWQGVDRMTDEDNA